MRKVVPLTVPQALDELEAITYSPAHDHDSWRDGVLAIIEGVWLQAYGEGVVKLFGSAPENFNGGRHERRGKHARLDDIPRQREATHDAS